VCGRYSLDLPSSKTSFKKETIEKFPKVFDYVNVDIAPSTFNPIIFKRQDQYIFEFAKWGFEYDWLPKGKLLFNVRSETVFEKSFSNNLIKTSKNDSLNIDFFDLQKNKNYYKGIKFTFFAKDVRGEIAGGGRYNLKYGSNSETAIGYTCYMDTILRSSSLINQNKRILIAFNTSDKIKQKLINKGYSLFKTFEDNSNIKKEAKKFGIKYYLMNKIVKQI